MRRFKKKSTAIIVGVLVVLVGAGAAFAYWTAGGSGSGTAATGTIAPITAVQTSVVTAMAPGDTAQSLNGTFLNANTSPVYVATVTASISGVTKADGAAVGTCDASDYTLAGAVMTVNAEALVNDTSTWTGATIKFNNKAGVNQDACKNATVALAYVIA